MTLRALVLIAVGLSFSIMVTACSADPTPTPSPTPPPTPTPTLTFAESREAIVLFLTGVNQIWIDAAAIFNDLGIDDPAVGATSSDAALVLTAMLNRLESLDAPADREIRTLVEGFNEWVAGTAEFFGALRTAAADGEVTESEIMSISLELLVPTLAPAQRAGEAQSQLLSKYAIPATQVGFGRNDWGM